MGFFDKLKSKAAHETILYETDRTCVYCPIKGEIIPLKAIADGVFSEEILGKGCGINPSEGKVVAPFDGEIVQVARTQHALGLKSNSGIELLIHIGMDTTKMNGAGFKPMVKIGDKVKCGQMLMTFSIPEIEAAGYPTTTAVVVTNTDDYSDVTLLGTGFKNWSEKLLQVI